MGRARTPSGPGGRSLPLDASRIEESESLVDEDGEVLLKERVLSMSWEAEIQGEDLDRLEEREEESLEPF